MCVRLTRTRDEHHPSSILKGAPPPAPLEMTQVGKVQAGVDGGTQQQAIHSPFQTLLCSLAVLQSAVCSLHCCCSRQRRLISRHLKRRKYTYLGSSRQHPRMAQMDGPPAAPIMGTGTGFQRSKPIEAPGVQDQDQDGQPGGDEAQPTRLDWEPLKYCVNLARSAAWRGEKGGGREGEGEEKEKAASMAEIGLLRNHGRDGTCSSPTPSSARRGSNPALRCLF
ncbi:hypothetical protein L207DRAFT_560887 [Hyaloscypha variabilis F]|uniref:Uncharacterized protein n=1 Tax=Hyaloscypha variabilis (strain UAMH 11265 / GT02V1 / F) TaxID=1149755 RepID=A0A2J6S9D2_HYAVF|nr:hypothetical protein L207DRAFT_560887 [Hyaloscypha variabilis F]